MRCLHIIHRYWPARGGFEKYMMEMSRRLASDGDLVTVFTTDAIDIQHFYLPEKEHATLLREDIDGVDVRRFRVTRFPRHRQFQRVLRKLPGLGPKSLFATYSPVVPGMLAVPEQEFDIVHATPLPFDTMLYAGYRISRKQKIPFVVSPFFHLGEPDNDEISRNFTNPHQIKLVKSADRVIVQTEIEKSFLLDQGLAADKMVLLGMGINPDELAGGSGSRFREKHKLVGPMVCHIGPKTYDKGTFHLVQAMESLWRRGDPASLVLAGTNFEDFRNYHQGLPENLRSKCLMLDYIPEADKRDLLDACNLVALPSRADSFGIVFLEAWAYGKPVIGARAGGIPGLLREGVDGLLVPFGDVKELAICIQKLLRDRDFSRKLGEAGRERVMAEFTWDEKYRTLEGLYRELLEEGTQVDPSGRNGPPAVSHFGSVASSGSPHSQS